MVTPDWEQFYKRLREPDFVPGYEVQGLLGHGSFGLVYKAKKISVGRPCAIKFLKVDDPAIGQAVMRELSSLEHLAQLDHPNLVSIEDQGDVEGIPYIVMGYGGDETLANILADKQALLPTEVAPLVSQICGAVQALHDHGVIHFDIKPGNVFLRAGRPRLGDYGLARLITQSRRTLSFGRGTPLYMAPELLDRKGDERSDIYSLGVLLYECLAGEPPFKGETEWEVMKRHESSILQFGKDFPAEFRGVVAKAMAKDPEARFQSAREMATTMQTVIGGSIPPLDVSHSRCGSQLGGRPRPKSQPTSTPRPAPATRVMNENEFPPLQKSQSHVILRGVDWFLALPGWLLGKVFKYGFKLFGFTIELFLLFFIVMLLIEVLGMVIGWLNF